MSTNSSTATQLQRETLLNGPALPPPAATLPDFQKAPGLERVFLATNVLSFGLPSAALLLRIYTKHFLLRSIGYDDYASVLAWLNLIAFVVINCLLVKARVGVHTWDLRLKDFFGMLQLLWLSSIFYILTAFFAKVSILFQYSRIFNPTGRGNLSLFLAIRVVMIGIFIFYVVTVFLAIFQCSPIEKTWNKLITTGHCYDYLVVYKASGIFNVISDFAILIMPITCVWNLHIPLRKKLLTSSVFAFGFLVCLTSILRTYYTWRFVDSRDKSYEAGRLGLWCTAELAVGIITGCLPTMPRFVQHVGLKLHSVFSSLESKRMSDSSRKFTSTTLSKIKAPFSKRSTGLSTSNTDTSPYASQPHGEYCMLDEIGTSQHQADRNSVLVPSGGAATSRDDLEYGHQTS